MSTLGGARIATIAGILSPGTRKGPWWIPVDQYIMRYGTNKEANITPQLMQIREAILARSYNVNDSAPKCTIQQVHQETMQPISPCRKSKCGCKGELAKQGVVAASRKTSSVPAHALATAIVGQIQTRVNELSLLRIKLILVMNTC